MQSCPINGALLIYVSIKQFLSLPSPHIKSLSINFPSAREMLSNVLLCIGAFGGAQEWSEEKVEATRGRRGDF
jgi:hypothetical protein